MRRPIGWAVTLGALGLGAACSTTPATPTPPAGPASSWSGPAATVVVSAPSPSGGWVTMEVARSASARPRPGPALATCVAELRGSRLDAPDSETQSYATALAAEQDGQLPAARKAYYDMIVQAPGSPYIPMVYLAFGELFAVEAADDPSKWGLARQAYLEVLKYPPARNLVHGYALLRLAEAALRLGDAPAALDGGRRTLTAVSDRSPCGPLLRARALDIAVEAYAVTAEPTRAPAFFRALLGADADLDAPLVDLGRRYVAAGKTREACSLSAASGSPRVQDSLRSSCRP